jgi:hypothetical protein
VAETLVFSWFQILTCLSLKSCARICLPTFSSIEQKNLDGLAMALDPSFALLVFMLGEKSHVLEAS